MLWLRPGPDPENQAATAQFARAAVAIALLPLLGTRWIHEEEMVGAAGFEPTTTSPPGCAAGSTRVYSRSVCAGGAFHSGPTVSAHRPLLLPAMLPAAPRSARTGWPLEAGSRVRDRSPVNVSPACRPGVRSRAGTMSGPHRRDASIEVAGLNAPRATSRLTGRQCPARSGQRRNFTTTQPVPALLHWYPKFGSKRHTWAVAATVAQPLAKGTPVGSAATWATKR